MILYASRTTPNSCHLVLNNVPVLLFIPGDVHITLSVYPTEPVEGDNVTLRCSNISDSRPIYYTPQTQYRWWRNNETTSEVTGHLFIDPITAADHDVVYRCEGQEANSTYTGEDTITLDVTYKIFTRCENFARRVMET